MHMIWAVYFFVFGILQFRALASGEFPIPTSVDDVGSATFAVHSVLPAQREAVTAMTMARTPGKLRYIENSGICETTEGVYQASGYADIADNKSLWFWYFAARESPEKAPLALWFNGGPGSTSMISLIRGHGPCRITNDSESVVHNDFSWNNKVNMLYIDQPVGTGFSYGSMDARSSDDAAKDIWTFLQIFLADSKFKPFADRNAPIALWTESYGGHYVPAFSTYILAQNEGIKDGSVRGTHLNLQAVGIGNGFIDPLTHYRSYPDFAASNPYHPLVNDDTISRMRFSLTSQGGCEQWLRACNNAPPENKTIISTQNPCINAMSQCNEILQTGIGPYNVYFVLHREPDPYPPDVTGYLMKVADQIGAAAPFTMSNIVVYYNFVTPGDLARSYVPEIEKLVDAGIRMFIYAGDVDFICNNVGVERILDNLNTTRSEEYQQAPWQNFTVRGEVAGQSKKATNLEYLRLYGAGHEVPAYKAAAAMFESVMVPFISNSSTTTTSPSGSSSGKPEASSATRRRPLEAFYLDVVVMSAIVLFVGVV